MAQQVYITLTLSSGISSSDTLTITASGGVTVIPNTCTLADIQDGLVVIVDSDTINTLTITASTGVCDGTSDTFSWNLATPTPTPTSTPTGTPGTTPTPTPSTTSDCSYSLTVQTINE